MTMPAVARVVGLVVSSHGLLDEELSPKTALASTAGWSSAPMPGELVFADCGFATSDELIFT